MQEVKKFVTIASDGQSLYALDEDGNVWKYRGYQRREGKEMYSTWVELTQKRVSYVNHDRKEVYRGPDTRRDGNPPAKDISGEESNQKKG